MPFARVNDIELHYETEGEGPELLLISGLGGDVRNWELLLARLSRSFRVAELDNRGSGRSEKPKEPYTIEQMTADAHEFIHKVCGGHAHVLGHSMGGCIAMQLALSHPDDVDTLILLSTLPSIERPHPIPGPVRKMISRTDVCPELLEEVYEAAFGPDYRKKHPSEEFVDYRLHDDNPQPAYAYLNQVHALEKFDLYNDVGKIDKRTLIITGNADEIVPYENSVWLESKIPNSMLEILDGVGHEPHIEVPDKLAECLISNI